DVEPVFGFLKANLRFTRFSVRGKSKVENEMGLALLAVNLRKYTANKQEHIKLNSKKWRKENLSELKFSFLLIRS
ncbi:transposase, partial [Lysinibacillus boronitolerans]